jgi:cyclopropane fatty-acyl-phospholipid synthase-like methyltransferase
MLFCQAILFTGIVSSQTHHHRAENDTTTSVNAFMHQSSTEELIKDFESPGRDAYQQPEKVLNYLAPLKGKKVMDIGAGSGYFSVKLANAGAEVIAADVDEAFQAALKKRIETQKLSHITLRKIDFDSPLLSNNEVDMVLLVNTYHHIEGRVAYFEKVKSGLSRGGELVIIDFFKSDIPVGPPVAYKISMDEVLAELKKAGFSHFEVNVDLLMYQYIIRAKR